MNDAPQSDEKAPAPKPDRIVEPEIVPTHVVNRILGGGYLGSLFDLVLAENRISYDPQGQPERQAVIVARIRFDRDFAKVLQMELGRILAATEPPPKDQIN